VPKVVDADAQRALIRGAARAVFARRGVVGTGLAQVASEAGVSRTGLYHYYPDKAALVRDLARELLEEEERSFQAALDASGSVAERIERLADGIVERFVAWASLGRPLLEIWARDARRMRPVLRRMRAALATLIAEGQRRGELARTLAPSETAALLVGLIDGLMLQVFIDPSGVPPSREIRDALAETLSRILRPRSSR
jgi:AcrR family transcriptional regulator